MGVMKRTATTLTASLIAQHRLRNQRLLGEPFETAEGAVRHLTAVQSQDYPGAKWALGQRLKGVSDRQLDELFNAGKILRTHVMRPTWHFVLPEDIRWLLALTAPRVNAASAYAYRTVELDDKVFRRSNAVLLKALRGGRQGGEAHQECDAGELEALHWGGFYL